MSWQDRIVAEGSFRGVPFWYSDVEGEIGRRTSLKEFPGRDQPFIEDLGRRARRFTIEMFVLGADYDVARDRLREALETAGPGELEHPYWGVMDVTVDGPVRVRESTSEQGMARFTVTFVEAGAELTVTQVPDTASAVVDAAAKVSDVSVDQFAEAFSVLDTIEAAADAAVAMVQAAASAINSVRGKIAAALQVIDDMKAAIDSVVDGVVDLINAPINLANSLTDLYHDVLSSIDSVTDAFENLTEFFGADGSDAVASTGNVLEAATKVDTLTKAVLELSTFGTGDVATFPTIPEDDDDLTAHQAQMNENQRQLVRLVKTSVAVEASLLAASLDFDSVDQATTVRDLVTDLIDELLVDSNLPDELYAPLYNLRACVVEHLGQAADSLPELDDYVPNATTPALVIAYQIYGDSKREAEILARNPQLRDPTAVPGGQVIKVLSDE